MLIAVVAGIVVGLLVAGLGGGGAILTVPVLVYALDKSPHEATTSSLVIVGISSLVGLWSHHRAGTVQWAWGLDDLHLYPGPQTDVRMQQATVNLFADMGMQPLTLQSGLVLATQSSDTVGQMNWANVGASEGSGGPPISPVPAKKDTAARRASAASAGTNGWLANSLTFATASGVGRPRSSM